MAAQGTYAPIPAYQYTTDLGVIATGYKLFTYAAGTSTKLATYTDVNLGSANTNPIVLDAAARPTIFLQPLSYKFVLAGPTDTDPPTSPIWTRDNIGAVLLTGTATDITGTAGEIIGVGNVVYIADTGTGLTDGRWYNTDATAKESSTMVNMMGVATTGGGTGDTITIRIMGEFGTGTYTAGTLYYLSATPGSLTSVAPTNARAFAIANSGGNIEIGQWVPIPDAAATYPGKVSTGTQTFAGLKTFSVPPKFNEGGAATADAIVSGRVSSTYADIGNVGAGEDNLHTYSLPANSLNADGKSVRVTAWGTAANNANAKTVKIYFGSTAAASLALTINQAKKWRIVMDVVRTAAATQRASAALLADVGDGSAPQTSINTTAPGETLSGAVTIKCTGTATSDNDIVQSAMIVEVVG